MTHKDLLIVLLIILACLWIESYIPMNRTARGITVFITIALGIVYILHQFRII